MSELDAQKLAGKILDLSDSKREIKKRCFRKLENRWKHYLDKKISHERAVRRYRNYKMWLEEEYKVSLGIA